MKQFMEISKLGKLNVDVVLFESYYPILFTCLNDNKDLFLCVCCQSNKEGRKWLITKTTPQIVIRILKNQVTVRDAFLMFPEVQITVFDDSKQTLIKEHNKLDWDEEKSISLPDKGEFLDAEDGEFDDEIAYFTSLDCNDYQAISCERKINLSNEQIRKNKNFMNEFDLVNIYYNENSFCLENSEIYTEKVKKEMQKLIFDQHSVICINYNEKYEEVEKKNSKASVEFEEYTKVESCIKEISKAA